MGDGDINSAIMLIGEAPGKIEDNLGLSFQGEIGALLKKMLSGDCIFKQKNHKVNLFLF